MFLPKGGDFAKDAPMKKILMVFGLMLLLPVSESLALIGGPFDNNTYGGRRGGVYQVIMMIPNGNGIARFSDEIGTQISTFSDSSVYYKGIIYIGNAFGIVDLDMGYVSGMTNGTSDGGQNTNASGGYGGAGTAPTATTTQGRSFSSSGGNIGICNTSFTGKVDEQGATTRMSGDGVASFFGELDTVTLAQDVDVDTDDNSTGELVSDLVSSIEVGPITDGTTTIDLTIDVVDETVDAESDAGSVTTTSELRSTLGESSEFDQVGHTVKFEWFGSRINTSVPTPRTDTINGTQFVANPGMIDDLPGAPGQANVNDPNDIGDVP